MQFGRYRFDRSCSHLRVYRCRCVSPPRDGVICEYDCAVLQYVGTGPKYSIGAALLDKNDPSKLIGRLREPLLRPDPSEGYFPNVV